MSFEKFTQTQARTFKARLSVRANGTIALNEGAVAKFKLSEYKFVVLYYDVEKSLIGLRPTNDEEEDGVHRLNRGKKGAWVSASKFVDYYGLSDKKTRRSDARWDDEAQMVVAEASRSQRKV